MESADILVIVLAEDGTVTREKLTFKRPSSSAEQDLEENAKKLKVDDVAKVEEVDEKKEITEEKVDDQTSENGVVKMDEESKTTKVNEGNCANNAEKNEADEAAVDGKVAEKKIEAAIDGKFAEVEVDPPVETEGCVA